MPGTRRICPCGSGKSITECCSGRDVLSLAQVRWRRAGQSLRHSLGEFADQPSFAWDAARAQDLYLGCLKRQFVDHDDDFIMERCFEWFIFDYKLSSNQTVIESFMEEYSSSLDQYEAVMVREWVKARISLFEVKEVIAGKGLNIKDLLSRKTFNVHDINAALEIEAGNILLMRVLKVGNEFEFSTSGLALPAHCQEPMLKWLRCDREEFQKGKKAGDWGRYLRERAHLINARVLEFNLFNSNSDVNSPEDEGPGYRSIFPIESFKETLQVFRNTESVSIIRELKDSSGATRQCTAALLSPLYLKNESGRNQKTGVNGLRQVIGHLILTPRFMIITAVSQGLLKECERIASVMLSCHVPASRRPGVQGCNCTDGEAFLWLKPGYAAVAGSVREGLEKLGYDPVQQKGAVKLWYDYCSKERPAIRKEAVWAATVIYAFTRVEVEEGLKQQELAWRYGVASSTISSKFRLLCSSLQLIAYDNRYSTKKPPHSGKGDSGFLFRRLPGR